MELISIGEAATILNQNYDKLLFYRKTLPGFPTPVCKKRTGFMYERDSLLTFILVNKNVKWSVSRQRRDSVKAAKTFNARAVAFLSRKPVGYVKPKTGKVLSTEHLEELNWVEPLNSKCVTHYSKYEYEV